MEAKFVKNLGMSRQLSDAIWQSNRYGGGPLELAVAPGTKISGPPQKEINAGNVNLTRMTETGVSDMIKGFI